MIGPQLLHSRYLTKARAAYAARLVAASSLAIVPAACGSSDADVLTGETSGSAVVVADTAAATPASTAAATDAAATNAAATTSPATQAAATDAQATQAPATNAPATNAAAGTEPATEGAATSAGTAIPSGSEMTLDFTYAVVDGGGRVHNPYIAAWVEDADGNLVQTIALWYQSGKGDKWLPDLSSWYSASDGTDVTTSGATRTPGTYSVTWDGSDWSGAAAPAGTYTIFVEAAREKGPYSITSAEVTLDGSSLTATLPDNNELSALTIAL